MRYTHLLLDLVSGCRFGAGGADRQRALVAQQELAQYSTHSARRVHARYSYLHIQAAHDFADSAPGRVTEAALRHFGPFALRVLGRSCASVDPGAGWIYNLLKNDYHSLARRPVMVQLARAGNDEGSAANPLEMLAAPAFEPEIEPLRLSDADVAAIRRWNPVDALILLALGGLYELAPEALWNTVTRDAGAVRLNRSAVAATDKFKLRDSLAQHLGVTRNAIDQRWRRKRHMLLRLRIVRKTLDDAPRLAAVAAVA